MAEYTSPDILDDIYLNLNNNKREVMPLTPDGAEFAHGEIVAWDSVASAFIRFNPAGSGDETIPSAVIYGGAIATATSGLFILEATLRESYLPNYTADMWAELRRSNIIVKDFE